MAKKGQKFKNYSSKLKEEVIRLYFEEQLPKRTIASLLDIDQSRVRLWINNYLTHGTVELCKSQHKNV
ncbi:hypothetical protein XJ44_08280 [Thermosipho affectus]|uniref:Transposase n=1 Tax=Thermosipho affectus TaxID=660294 RepID=A0ABX3IH12_9BACT|nr:helix-turn-helix domain-containing protein [Thermosipho affectus]ONN26456.1 hypothetical protein XJ44_08280 [Thermosipho affectus]